MSRGQLKNGNCLLYIQTGSRFTGQKCAHARFVNPKLLLFATKGGLAWPIIPAKSRNQFCALALAVPFDQGRHNSAVSWSRNIRLSVRDPDGYYVMINSAV